MNNGRLVGLLLGLMSILLLWLLLRPTTHPESAGDAVFQAESRTGSVAASPDIGSPSPHRSLVDALDTVGFRILNQGMPYSVSGELRTSSWIEGSRTHAVSKGTGSLSVQTAEQLLTFASAASSPATFHWSEGDAAVEQVAENPELGVLDLHLAPLHSVVIQVTDLQGIPVSGAAVSAVLDLPHAIQAAAGVTDESGNAHRWLSRRGSLIQFRVSKDGYVPHQQCLEIVSVDTAIQVKLRRILGFAVAVDRRWRASTNASFGAGVSSAIGLAIPRTVHQQLLEDLESKAALDARLETLSLHLFAETRWFEGSTGAVGLVVRGDTVARMEIPVLPIADPGFNIHRFPANATSQLESHPQVQLQMHPEESFLALPPEELFIRVGVVEGEPDVIEEAPYCYARMRRVRGLEYNGFLPIGTYELLTTGPDWTMGDGNLGDAGDPGFAPDQRFEVIPGHNPTIPVSLGTDEKWIRYSIHDLHGRQLDLRAKLFPHRDASHPTESNFRFQTEPWPQGRFIRPGEYDLLANVRNGMNVIRLHEVLNWPPQGNLEDGLLRIVLPVQGSGLDPYDFQ